MFWLWLDAGLLALCLFLILMGPPLSQHHPLHSRWTGLAGVVVLAAVFLPLTLAAWRTEQAHAREFAALIVPYPGGRVHSIPRVEEVAALAAGLAALQGDSEQANALLREAKEAASDPARPRFWQAETKDSARTVHDFYERLAPHHGWKLNLVETGVGPWLERGDEVLWITAHEGWTETSILYAYWPQGVR